MNKSSFLGLELVNSTMRDFVSELFIAMSKSDLKFPLKIYTPNPEMYVLAENTPEFSQILSRADYLLPDGIGIQYWAKILWNISFEQRLTGSDLTNEFLRSQKKIYLVGGASGAAHTVAKEFSSVCGYFDGLVDLNSSSQLLEIAEKINASGAEVVLIGLGAYKQELLIYKISPMLKNAKVIAGIGGSIDFVAGVQIRAPRLFRDLGLEWVFRLYKEPKRVLRIWNAVVVFSFLSIKKRLKEI
jgi:N-acetylglucosaminyldiphosphoundecaprenol N-acetyl-beta-D-mannosaminyltransferase